MGTVTTFHIIRVYWRLHITPVKALKRQMYQHFGRIIDLSAFGSNQIFDTLAQPRSRVGDRVIAGPVNKLP